MDTTTVTPSAPGRAAPRHDPAAITAVHAMRAWSIGEVIGGRFEVLDLLARGAMAAVYRCKDLQLHSFAAVKLLTAEGPDPRRRFEEEGRLLGNLRHPHLVQVRAAGVDERGWPYLALEYLSGESLRSHVRRGPLPWREVVEIGIQVASVLEALHAAGVIHRDVKPDNLMLDRGAARQPFVKLIDLNIAKVHSWEKVQGAPTQHMRHETGTNQAVGTEGYMAPERTVVPPDPRFDVFGLGVTLYELCTRRVPNPREYRPMRAVQPECGAPNELEEYIAAALEELPEARLPDAYELRRRLEAVRRAHAEDRNEALFEGRYELVESLGVGATSEVFRAYHLDGCCYVALKLLSRRSREHELESARFRQEARALGAMKDPGLPRLLDCRTTGEQPFIAMDLVAGRPALQFCQVDTRLHPAEVVSIGLQLARTLGAVHGKGILHRDINASNVLIDFPQAPVHRQRPKAMLIDFGMAELGTHFYAAAQLRYPTKPEDRRVLGSGGLEQLAWTAPEGRTGMSWSVKSDVYSLGFLLYRLLTGRLPHDDQGELVPPQRRAPEISSALGFTIVAALQRDPEQRLSLDQLIEQLEDAEAELDAETKLAPRGERQVGAGEAPTMSIGAGGPGPVEDGGAATIYPANSGPKDMSEAQGVGEVAPSRAQPRRGTGHTALAGVGIFLVGVGLGGLALGAFAEQSGPPAGVGTSAGTHVAALPVEPDTAASSPRIETPPRPATRSPKAEVAPAETPEQALADAAPALRACAARVGSGVTVELGAPSSATAFETIEVLAGEPDVVTCFRRVLTALRFRPATETIDLLHTIQP